MLESALHALSVHGHDAVLYGLVFASLVTVAITLERLLYQFGGATKTASLKDLSTADVPLQPELLIRLEEAEGFEGRVVSAGLKAGAIAGSAGAEEALAAALLAEQEGLDRGLNIIGSVGANAPFVGLLGTVLGIVRAFSDLAVGSAEGSAAVMAGISEALVATAIGLLVAIPAVILYNWLSRRNESLMRRLEQLSRVVLLQLEADEARAKTPLHAARGA
jgi:biopolymer transport protein ExbB